MTRASRLGGPLALALLMAIGAVGGAQAQQHNAITFEDGEEGWMLLFYGTSLADWTISGDAEWRVENDAIVADSGGRGLLLTVDEYENFEMVVDFLADPGTNSGIFLRTVPNPSDMQKDGYELNIAPLDHPFPTGSLVSRKKVEGVEEVDDWRTFHIEAIDGHIKVKLDGEPILEYEDPEPIEKGYIGLQHNEGRIAFRNIKFRRL